MNSKPLMTKMTRDHLLACVHRAHQAAVRMICDECECPIERMEGIVKVSAETEKAEKAIQLKYDTAEAMRELML